MTKQKWFLSLRMKMLLTVLAALAGAAGIYYLSDYAINAGIDRWYMTDSRIAQRNQAQVAELQEFVTEQSIAATDTTALSEWTAEHYAYLLVMMDGGAVEVGWWGLCDWSELTEPEKFQDAYGASLRDVQFADGTHAVLAEDYSDYRLYRSIDMVCNALASLFVLVVILLYQGHNTKRMMLLSKQVQKVSAGDLQREIAVKGHDELAAVAEHVNTMRNAVVEQMRSEQRAWQANSNLIKSMSHDVRNPLTTLMGYLELAREQEGLPAEVQEYLQISSSKAQQLKELTDELFQYFLVFGSPDLQMNLEQVDAAAVLNQMLGEHLVELEHSGWRVEKTWLNDAGSIRVDVLRLNQVFDNLFSNIKKYADPTAPVTVRVTVQDGRVQVLLQNERNADAGLRESNGIGLKSCEKMIGNMGGGFRTAQEKTKFTAAMWLPLGKDAQ